MEQFKRPIFYDEENMRALSNYYTRKAKTGSGLGGFSAPPYQDGDGLGGFSAPPYQDGDGFIDFFKAFGLPIIKYFGRKGASTLVKAGSEALAGENFVESLKKNAKSTAENVVNDAAVRATKFIQTGKGHKKRKRSSRNKAKKSRKSGRTHKKSNLKRTPYKNPSSYENIFI